MSFTHEQLKELGYSKNADGSYSRNQIDPKRIPHAKPQLFAKQALEPLHKREEVSRPRTRIRITRYSCRPLDCDNYAGGCKPIIDQLRYAKLIKDDDPETIEVEFKQVKIDKKTKERTEIEIVTK